MRQRKDNVLDRFRAENVTDCLRHKNFGFFILESVLLQKDRIFLQTQWTIIFFVCFEEKADFISKSLERLRRIRLVHP